MKDESSKLTVRQAAGRLAVSPDKIRAWIRSGELVALDVSRKVGGRPRFRIDAAALLAFEERRRVRPQSRVSRRLRARSTPKDVIQFF
jgi:excisionase family DNA binding protein